MATKPEPPPADGTPKEEETTLKEEEECSQEKKRSALETPDESSSPDKKRARTLLDAAAVFYQPGDRIEVQWDIVNETTNVSTTRWWGATLLPHDGTRLSDGRHEGIAVRTLDYDPYPEGGFPDRSREQVIFMGKHKILQLENGQELDCRKEGVVSFEGGVQDAVDGVLARAMQNHSSAFHRLDAAQQAHVADKVRKGKEKLLEALENCLDGKQDRTLTGQDVSQVLEQAFGKRK